MFATGVYIVLIRWKQCMFKYRRTKLYFCAWLLNKFKVTGDIENVFILYNHLTKSIWIHWKIMHMRYLLVYSIVFISDKDKRHINLYLDIFWWLIIFDLTDK